MARNLVREKQLEDEEDYLPPLEEAPPAPKVEAPKEEVTKVITFENWIANILQQLQDNQITLYNRVTEGFKQVGVKFEDQTKD